MAHLISFSQTWLRETEFRPDMTQKELEVQDERVQELLMESQGLPFIVDMLRENHVTIEALDDDQVSTVNVIIVGLTDHQILGHF